MGRACICDAWRREGNPSSCQVPRQERDQCPRISEYGSSEVEAGVIPLFQAHVGDSLCPRDSSTGEKGGKF